MPKRLLRQRPLVEVFCHREIYKASKKPKFVVFLGMFQGYTDQGLGGVDAYLPSMFQNDMILPNVKTSNVK